MALAAVVLLLPLMVGLSLSQCPMIKVSKPARQELLQSQLRFSVDLLRNVGELQSEENVFFSPSSVYNALLMAYFASANETEKYLKETLRLGDKIDKSHVLGAYSWERKKQSDRAVMGFGKYKLSNVNRMYVSKEETILQCIEMIFKNEIVSADLTNNISSTIEEINQFVSSNTNNEINDFLSADSLNENTNLVLVNAAYFRGLWTNPFLASDTRTRQFKLANGSSVPVTMMTQENKFNHWIDEDLGVEVLELPYLEANISMYILLPLSSSPSALSEVLNKTNEETLMAVLTNNNETNEDVMTITIPKFTVDQTLDLTPVLESMGVGDLFQPSADLSGLTGNPGLKLDQAVHKAKVVVDEVGTTAAAATAIFANRFAADIFQANHPFIYLIFDKMANTILFAGIFNSPEQT